MTYDIHMIYTHNICIIQYLHIDLLYTGFLELMVPLVFQFLDDSWND